jgi:hypothetical protein
MRRLLALVFFASVGGLCVGHANAAGLAAPVRKAVTQNLKPAVADWLNTKGLAGRVSFSQWAFQGLEGGPMGRVTGNITVTAGRGKTIVVGTFDQRWDGQPMGQPLLNLNRIFSLNSK